MPSIRHLLAPLMFCLMTGSAWAGLAQPQDGVEYTTLATPQPVAAGKKIEVIEFFGYYCPHCHAFDAPLADWVARQGERITFRRIHVVFRESMLAFLQARVTLEALGQADAMHGRIFRAMHVERQALVTEEQILAFLVAQGVDRQRYLDMYRSPAIQEAMRRSLRAQAAFGIDGVPMLAIDGRYIVSPQTLQAALASDADAVLHAAMLTVSEALITRIAAERGAR